MNIEELAKAAGMESALNMGSGSCVSSPGCNGVTQEQLERFADLVVEECARVCEHRAGYEVTDLGRSACLMSANAIRKRFWRGE